MSSKSVSPVLCKFWWLCGGVNGNLLQEGLCHTEVYCTQSPCPCGRPLLTCISTGDTQTQFWLSLCEGSGSWCTQGLFEPSKDLWKVWGLILNLILPLLPTCWGFSFALGHGVYFFWWDLKFSCPASFVITKTQNNANILQLVKMSKQTVTHMYNEILHK